MSDTPSPTPQNNKAFSRAHLTMLQAMKRTAKKYNDKGLDEYVDNRLKAANDPK